MEIHEAALCAFKNRKHIESCELAGCYHCLATFSIDEINSYTDKGQTVLCPKCDVDAVLGSKDTEMTQVNLSRINKNWF